MRRRLFLIALGLAATAPFASAAVPLALPGPAIGPRARTVDHATVRSDSCASCHADIDAEWRASLHRQSWSDPIFQKSYAMESRAFCRGCHAPEADPKAAPTAAAIDEGVGCVTCHVQRGSVVGAHATGGDAHAIRADPRLADVGACASCHQFDFPPASHQLVRSAMQGTVAEWRASDLATTSCQGCHMPLVRGRNGALHAKHDFRVAGDADELARALTVRAERGEDGAIVLHLASAAVGHALPTGDMFRRLEVRARVSGGTDRRVGLSRVFRDVPRHPESATDFSLQRVEDADTRLGPPGSATAARDVILAVGARETDTVEWEVAYQRMMTPITPSTKPGELEDETIVARGTL